MAMDHKSSLRAAAGGGVGLVGGGVRRVPMVACRAASVASRSRLGRLLHLWPDCGLRCLRLAGQEGAEGVLRGDEGRHAGGKSRSQARFVLRRQEVFEVVVGRVHVLCVDFRCRHERGGRRRLVERFYREDLECCSGPAELPDRALEDEIALRELAGE